MTFGEIDAEHSASHQRISSVRGLFFDLTAVRTLVYGDHGPTSLEGKANGPRSGETTNESCKLPRRLRASAVTYHPQRTINEGPFSRRLEAH